MNPVAKTIVGNFPTLENAQAAVADLRHSGYQDVRLVENDTVEGQTTHTHSDDRAAQHEGGITGFFSRLFGFDDGHPTRPISHESETYFRSAYQNQQHLVIVGDAIQPDQCKEIMRRFNGTIEEESGRLFEQEVYSDRRGDERVMELREEQLEVGKERVQSGEVSLRKEVITEMKTIEVPVTREEIVVERRSLDGKARPGNLSMSEAGRSEEIRIPVSEEHIHVEKKVVPREEIRVSKERTTETEVVSEQVRREEAHIESEGRVKMKDRDATLSAKKRRDNDPLQPSI